MVIKKRSLYLVKKYEFYGVLWRGRLRYVSKIVFTYILGYKVDVGHMEAVNLISSHKYSEKQIVRIIVMFLQTCNVFTYSSTGILGCDPFDARKL